MVKTAKSARLTRRERNDTLFHRADQHSERGELPAAFRLFLTAAKSGDRSSQLNVGYCYDTGKGVRQNPPAALYWYKRAYRRGDASAANNIGTIWRGRQKPSRALYWFRQAVNLGDESAYLEIAKLYLHSWHSPRKAISYLERVSRSQTEAEVTIEEAKRLLALTRRTLERSRKKHTIAT